MLGTGEVAKITLQGPAWVPSKIGSPRDNRGLYSAPLDAHIIFQVVPLPEDREL